jgi:hypothetical protein
VKRILKKLVQDTLMKYDNGKLRYSRTSLTMFSAWLLVVYMIVYDIYKEGFRYDVFVTMVGVALGTKVTDSISEKLKK